MAKLAEIEVLDIYAYIGVDNLFSLVYKNKASGQPIPLTNFTATLVVKDANGNVILTLAAGNGGAIIPVPQTQGIINISILGSLTAELAATLGSYRLSIFSPTNNQTLITVGQFDLRA